MPDKFFVGLDLTGIEDNGFQRPISRVTLLLDDENSITAGDDTGMELLADCPHATQAMANAILAKVKGYQYRMFSADDAALDPSAELGDGVTAGGIYSVISRLDDDGSGYSDISAPGESELEDEYPTEGPMTQEFNRKIAQTRSSITKTAEQIRLEVSNSVAGLNARITLEVNKLTTEINDTESGLNSKIEQTASSLTTQINNVNSGLSSKIEQTASSLTAKITATDGRVTSLSQTVDGISTRVSNTEGDISTLEQTASNLQFQIRNANNDISSVSQTVDSISLDVSNDSEYSTISLYRNGIRVESHDIEFTGMVTFSDLAGDGTTTINGGNISTGTINANYVSVRDSFAVYNGWQLYGYMGCGYGYDGNSTTYGAMLSSANGRNYILTASSGVRMEDDSGGAIWVTGGNCFSSSDMQTYSDRRLKADIDYDLECYKAFFRALKPCRFLMLSNPSGGYHTGFIAQDVQEAMEAANLSQMDFAGLADAKLPGGSWGLSLSYGSFSALNTYMIQDLDRRIAALERRVGNE